VWAFKPPGTDFPGELPENVAIDRRGNKYVSVPSVGQIWKFSPANELPENPSENPFVQFDTGGDFLVGPTGLEVDPNGTLFACFASDLDDSDTDPAPDANGVYRIDRDGNKSLYAPLPPANDEDPRPTFPNDILLFGDSLLVTDSFRGVVYRVWPDEAEVWASGGHLQGPSSFFPVGANGIAAAKDGTVYVANTDKGLLVEIPVEKDGSAGDPEIFVGEDEEDTDYTKNELYGADGLAIDTRENLYVALNRQNRIARVSPSRNVETLAKDSIGEAPHDAPLDAPSDVTFGTARGEQKTVFITNLTDLSTLSPDSNPSFMKLDVGVPGMPIHR